MYAAKQPTVQYDNMKFLFKITAESCNMQPSPTWLRVARK